jgi:hypothetical protein
MGKRVAPAQTVVIGSADAERVTGPVERRLGRRLADG